MGDEARTTGDRGGAIGEKQELREMEEELRRTEELQEQERIR